MSSKDDRAMTKEPDNPRGNDPYDRYWPNNSQNARGQQSGHRWEPYIAGQGPFTRPDATHIKGLGVERVLSHSWDGYTQNLGGWILWCLAYFIGTLAIFSAAIFGAFSLLAAVASDDVKYDASNFEFSFRSDGPASVVVFIVFAAVFLLAALVYMTFLHMAYNSSLRIAEGERLDVGDFFKFRNFGTYLATIAATVAAICVLFLVPVIGFFLTIPLVLIMFFLPFASIDGHSFAKCFSIAWDVLFRNFGLCLLCAIIFGVLNAIGGFVIVGYLITFPMMMVGSAVVYHAATRGYQPIPKPMPYAPRY